MALKLIGEDNNLSNYWDSSLSQAIIIGTAQASRTFIENLVLDRFGKPIVFWEQKIEPGTPNPEYSATEETDLVSARYDSGWTTTYISDTINKMLRVRRMGIGVMTDKNGDIHAYMPVNAQTYYRAKPTGDIESVRITRSAFSSNYRCVGDPAYDGLTLCDTDTWIYTTGSAAASFNHEMEVPSNSRILGLRIEAVAKKQTETNASLRLYIDTATSFDASSGALTVDNSSYEYFRHEWLKNPWTDAEWTSAEINYVLGVETGIRLGIKTPSSDPGVNITRINLQARYTVSSDDELFGTELWELISKDNGITWTPREVLRNSHLGGPIMTQEHHLYNDVMRIAWVSGNDIHYLTEDQYGFIQPSGQDLRLYYGTSEVDRILDYPNLDSSTIKFRVQSTVNANVRASSKDYYLYYGHGDIATQPKSDPNNVYLYFENFETYSKDTSLVDPSVGWSINTGAIGRIYQSPPDHNNKVFAGDRALHASCKPTWPSVFEASYIASASGISNAYFQAGIWNAGDEHQSVVIKARDGAQVNLVGVADNGSDLASTVTFPTFSVTTTNWKFADSTAIGNYWPTFKGTQSEVAMQITDRGASFWFDNQELWRELPSSVTSLKEIGLYTTDYAFYDYLRISQKLQRSTAYTEYFNMYEQAIDADSSSAIGDHDIVKSLQRDSITKLKFSVDFTPGDHDWSASQTILGKIHIARGTPYSAANLETTLSFATVTPIDWTFDYTSRNIIQHPIVNGVSCTDEWISVEGLYPGPKSFKSDYYSLLPLGVPTAEAYDILMHVCTVQAWDINTGDKDPTISVGAQEIRGFYADAAIQGRGKTTFNTTYETNNYFIAKTIHTCFFGAETLTSKIKTVFYGQGVLTNKINLLSRGQTTGASKIKVLFCGEISESNKINAVFYGAETLTNKIKTVSIGQSTGITKISGVFTGQQTCITKIKTAFHGTVDTSSKIKLLYFGSLTTNNKLDTVFSACSTSISKIKSSFISQSTGISKIKALFTGQIATNNKLNVVFSAAIAYSSKIKLSFRGETDTSSKIKVVYGSSSTAISKITTVFMGQQTASSKITTLFRGSITTDSKISALFSGVISTSSKINTSFISQSTGSTKINGVFTGQQVFISKINSVFYGQQVVSNKIKSVFCSEITTNNKINIVFGSAISLSNKIKYSFTGQQSTSSKIKVLSIGQISTSNKISLVFGTAISANSKIKTSFIAQSTSISKINGVFTGQQIAISKINTVFYGKQTTNTKINTVFCSELITNNKINVVFSSAISSSNKIKIVFYGLTTTSSKIKTVFTSQSTAISKIKLLFSSAAADVSKIRVVYRAESIQANRLKIVFSSKLTSNNKIPIVFHGLSTTGNKINLSFGSSTSTGNKINVIFGTAISENTKIKSVFRAESTTSNKISLVFSRLDYITLATRIKILLSSSTSTSTKIGLIFRCTEPTDTGTKLGVVFSSALSTASKIKIVYSSSSISINKVKTVFCSSTSKTNTIKLVFGCALSNTNKINVVFNTSGAISSKIKTVFTSNSSSFNIIRVNFTGEKPYNNSKISVVFNSVSLTAGSKIKLVFEVSGGYSASKIKLSFRGVSSRGRISDPRKRFVISNHLTRERIVNREIKNKISGHQVGGKIINKKDLPRIG